jgi:hypothetical protein
MALFALFYGPWQEACTDFTRQLLFERRDRLFDLAADGKLDFASEEYRALRASLESLIRYAHDFTWIQFILFAATYRPGHASTSGQLLPHQALAKIEDEEVRRVAKRQMDEAFGALMVMATMKSMLLAPIAGLIVLAAYCTRRINVFLAPYRHGRMADSVVSTIQRGAMAH